MSASEANVRATEPAMHKVWLLKLILPCRYGRLMTGLLLLAVLLPLFYSGAGGLSLHRTTAVFFSLIIAYIIPVFSFITEKSQESLLALRPILDLDDLAFERAQTRLDSASRSKMVRSLGAGALSGCVHISFIGGSMAAAVSEIFSSISGILTGMGTLMVWMVMTTVIVMLIQQSILFGKLGANEVRVSLLATRTLVPFASVSISSSLAIIGALAFFPLIGLESEMNAAESLPGVIAIFGSLIVMFIIPVWPVHRRLVKKKTQALASLDDRIGDRLRESDETRLESTDIDKLLPLLNYRREIEQVSTWPFDLDNVATLALYLVIVPLTWAGAALIENLVNALI